MHVNSTSSSHTGRSGGLSGRGRIPCPDTRTEKCREGKPCSLKEQDKLLFNLQNEAE